MPSTMADFCCTCAALLKDILPPIDEKTEKPALHDRQFNCCGRTICSTCLHRNSRFKTYCPFCQISIEQSPLPQGLNDPPPYTPNPRELLRRSSDEELPAYSTLSFSQTTPQKKPTEKPHEDVLHFLDHNQDTLYSLALRYGVPINALRKANNIASDHLLLARRTILIPGEYYKDGVSLNPRPIEGEEEELRKSKVRKWMVACKVSEYDVALLYLQQAEYNLEQAIEAYRDDERWEKEHQIEASASAKGKGVSFQNFGRCRFTGQRS